MTKHKVVYEFIGLYDTKKAVTPYCLLDDFTGDLEETTNGIRGFDDFGGAVYRKWQIRDIEIPDCFSFVEFKHKEYNIKFVMRTHKNWKKVPESILRWVVYHICDKSGFEYAEAIITLFSANLRSNFKKSLKAQVESWINTPIDDRKYTSPLSPKQWAALTAKRRF